MKLKKMDDTLKRIKKAFQDSLSGKKLSFSGGTVVFIIFNFLLIIGFCRFSFYVLKNHRSTIERESLVKTYVDVQPYRTNTPDLPSYLTRDSRNKNAPAPFFKDGSRTETAGRKNENALPQPLLNENKAPVPSVVASHAISRPPVIKQPAPPVVAAKKNVPTPPLSDENGRSLDGLILSGKTLLNGSEEKIAASELLLQKAPFEKSVYSIEQNDFKTTASDKSATVNIAIPAPRPEETTVEKNQIEQKNETEISQANSTHWVDVEKLRRRLSEKDVISTDREISGKQKTAFPEMNAPERLAASNIEKFSAADVQQNAPDDITEPVSEKNETETVFPVVAEETAVKETAVAENALSPDAQTAEENMTLTETSPQENEERARQRAKRALSGTAPALWKVAEVKGSKKASEEKKEAETKEIENKEPENSIPAENNVQPKERAIYRHGRKITFEQKPNESKSLNWLDRKEAAVWTSMAQSDTPSVWAVAPESAATESDRAKAFRVADEKPDSAPAPTPDSAPASSPDESNVVNSAPVRVVGEEAKPEAKENPLLLPLGTPPSGAAAPKNNPPPATTPAPVIPAPAKPAAVPSVPKTNPNGSSPLPSEEQVQQNKTETPEDSGIMDKFFSFFGKPSGTEDSLPSIGSGNAVPTDSDKGKKPPAENKLSAQKKTAQPLPAAPAKQAEEKKVLPTELRLTFKPNSTEMSAQTIKWIKAFGQQAKKDIQNAVEIRMSNVNPDLQSKRFSLIRSTLLGAGIEDVQILPVITDRTPHTIVLRLIALPEEGFAEYTTDKNGVKEHLYYKQW